MTDPDMTLREVALYEAMQEENALLRALLAEAADDLEGLIGAQYPEIIYAAYPEGRVFPSEQRRYDKDMDIVRRIRAALPKQPTKA